MSEQQYVVKKMFPGRLGTGIAAALLTFVAICIIWPIWGIVVKTIAGSLAGTGLAQVDAKVAAKYFTVFAECTFFWMVIIAWICHALILGNWGKTYLTARQPMAGIWYSLVTAGTGIVGFLVFVAIPGIWWEIFNVGILFTPKTAEEVHLAIEGFEVSNFYALGSILVHVPYAAIFHKWPFAGNGKPHVDSFAALSFSSLIMVVVWFATVIPSLIKVSVGGHAVTSVPFGAWPTYLAYAQAFIIFVLFPAEGAEHYPMKFFAKKQPYMGIAGLVISIIGAAIIVPVARMILKPLNLLPGLPLDLIVASFLLSIVTTILMWHHIFDDYPGADQVENQSTRVMARICIWFVLGSILGIIWLKTFKLLPFGANDLGMGFPTMGLLAGQFAFMLTYAYLNAFFDKWPLVRKVPVSE